jgi:HSP20 family molecular chaperone IbpA
LKGFTKEEVEVEVEEEVEEVEVEVEELEDEGDDGLGYKMRGLVFLSEEVRYAVSLVWELVVGFWL